MNFLVLIHIDVSKPSAHLSPLTVRISPYLSHSLHTLESNRIVRTAKLAHLTYLFVVFASWTISLFICILSPKSFACLPDLDSFIACTYTTRIANFYTHSSSFHPAPLHSLPIDMALHLYNTNAVPPDLLQSNTWHCSASR